VALCERELDMKVLVVFASPRGTDTLRLGEEDRVIQECIRRCKNRDHVRLTIKHAATVDDIRRALLDDDFDIVHFSGHGTGSGLAFEDGLGRLFVPPREAIANLLSEFSPPLQCAVLNACYSTSQGQFTSLGIPFTVAMEGPISDQAAIVFTGGFYDSVGAGRDIDFSFRQGVLALQLAGHPDRNVPRLLRKGEVTTIHADQIPAYQTDFRGADQAASEDLLVGIGIDVSGSMESNIDNKGGVRKTRLDGFTDALTRTVQRSRAFLESIRNTDAQVRFFAYAFGLRNGDVCDLFSLMRAAEGIISQEEIEELKQRYAAEIKARYSASSGLGGLESLARSYGLSGLVASAKQAVRADAEAEIKNRILAQIQTRLTNKLRTMGDLTLGLNELAELWNGSSSSMTDAEGLIFGSTPMCEALRRMQVRFQNELQGHHGEKIKSILLLISDGEPTDGNPETVAASMSESGIEIICCYITSMDITAPRSLYSSIVDGWPPGAKLMFKMSSMIPDNSPLTSYLLRLGWTLPAQSKAFIQVNQSEVLEELVGLALSPIEGGYELLPKGQ
jgi:hypothetical protein